MSTGPSNSRLDILIALLLVLMTAAVYSQVRHFDFVNYDDPDYVPGNSHVRAGLTAEGFAWAFRSFENANWFPVTWLSHMLDVQLYGLDSGSHHLTNVAIHLCSTILLLASLLRMTGSRWPSVFVAFVFALHPL